MAGEMIPQIGEEVVYFDSWGKPCIGRVFAIRAPHNTLDLSVGTPTHPQLVQNVSRAVRDGEETKWAPMTDEARALFARKDRQADLDAVTPDAKTDAPAKADAPPAKASVSPPSAARR